MDDAELERLERDLAAVEARLARDATWDALAPRVRRALRRPAWALARTVALVGAFAAAGMWLGALGLALALLPERVRALRDRRRALAAAADADLLRLAREEALRALAGHLVSAVGLAAIAVVYGVLGAFTPDPRPAWIAAGASAALAVGHAVIGLPRAARASVALRGADADAESEDA